jgi:hypothetical protein
MPLMFIPLSVALVVLITIVVGVTFCLVVSRSGSRIDLDRLERAGRVWRTIAGFPVRRHDDPD